MNGQELAFPFVETGAMQGESVNLGLTKREYFAAMALQGFIACSGAYQGIEARAVSCADRLLAELAKPTEATP